MFKPTILALIFICLVSVPTCDSKSTLRDLVQDHVNPEILAFRYKITESEFFSVIDYVENLILGVPRYIADVTCHVCKSSFGFMLSLDDTLLSDLADFIAYEVCTIGKIDSHAVCRGAVDEMTPIILRSLLRHYLNPLRVCPTLYLCPAYYEEEDINAFINETLHDKPIVTPAKPTHRETLKVVHISDIHMDFYYTPGTESKCGEPACCQPFNGPASSPANAAKYWGTLDASCDIPPYTVEQALRFIEETIQPDIVLWTGDTVGHTIWKQNQWEDINTTLWVTEQMKRTFNSSRTTVFPIDGNHECFPVNVFNYDAVTEDILRISFSEAWADWVGPKAAQDIRHNVFYSSVYDKLNLKVIAIDTNTCQDENWLLIEDPTDPAKMLAWLKTELQDAENIGQNVYIIGHIPLSSCMYQWAKRFETIVNRYSNTIKGQFFGHSHKDAYQMLYDTDRKTPIGAQFIAPSLTTFTNMHPSIRLIEVDADTAIPVNIKQYRLDIEKYNALGPDAKLEWDLAYDFLSEYEVDDLSLESLEKVKEKLVNDPVIGARYIRNQRADSTATGNATNYYCDMFGIHQEGSACNNGLTFEQQKTGFMELLTGPWIRKIAADE